MLSVLIPIYNQDVRKLVYTLAKQCYKANINFQILCFDDGSHEKFKSKNKELAFKMNINYTELPENLGRSKIRNWLGKAAYFEYLLFLDGDSSVRDKNFIKNYVDALPTSDVVYGGRIYQKKKPARLQKILHWKYGVKREALPAKKRNQFPFLNFQSNNFLIPAKVFESIPFSENVEGYGYEDLQYARKLELGGFNIRHINNPVLHDGLENQQVFIQKTKKAMENLVFLESKKQIPRTRMLDFQQRLEYFGLDKLLFKIITRYLKMVENNLKSTSPSIFLFSLWKWYWYSTYTKKQKQ